MPLPYDSYAKQIRMSTVLCQPEGLKGGQIHCGWQDSHAALQVSDNVLTLSLKCM